MRVSDVIARLEKMGLDSEIAIDWATKGTVEDEARRKLTNEEWECIVAEWEMTDFDDETYPVSGQVVAVMRSREDYSATLDTERSTA
jgi:hypothetical protein